MRAGEALAPQRFEPLRRAVMLRHCKWDPQVGDVATLSPFPLVLGRATALWLNRWSERLAAESMAAEAEMLEQPAVWEVLAVPAAIRSVLRRGRELGFTPAAARVMRFDFHPCADGWRLSEVNADVPGGFSEATAFTQLMADCHPGLRAAGAPGTTWADALIGGAESSTAALVYAPGFIEDLQVLSYLRELLAARGCRAFLCQPQHLRFEGGLALLEMDGHRVALDLVVRFFQAEWLPRLPRRVDWRPFFVGGRTKMANPGVAVLLESKRFPLVWDRLRTPLPTWRALLPETRPLRLKADASWMIKSAYSNNGDDVLNRELTPRAEWAKSTRWLALSRGRWLHQRRFEPRAVDTPWGPMHVCIGVYTVDGAAAGMYGRLSRGPIVDYRATDAAVLIEGDS